MQEAFTNWEIGVLHIFSQPTGSTGLPDKNSGRPRQASGASGLAENVQNPNFPICKCFLRHPGSSNPKKKAIFVVRGSSLIGKCQNMEIYFLGNATQKSLDGTTSYTLYQPCALLLIDPMWLLLYVLQSSPSSPALLSFTQSAIDATSYSCFGVSVLVHLAVTPDQVRH